MQERGLFEVVLIGGGISGVASSYYIEQLAASKNIPVHLTLIETSGRLGGKIATERLGRVIIEGGPDSFFTQKPFALDLCREIGLSGELEEADPATRGTYILDDGKPVKLPEGTETGMPSKIRPFMSTELISFAGKIRAMFDFVAPRKRSAGDESVGSFITRRFGKEFLLKIVEPMYAGIYAGDVYQLSAESTIPGLVALERNHGSVVRGMRSERGKRAGQNPEKKTREAPRFVTLKGGMIGIIEGLCSKLRQTEILLNETATGIFTQPKGGSGKYLVTTSEGRKLVADSVVLAVPAYAAAELIKELNPGLYSLLNGIKYASTATVTLGFPKDETAGKVHGHGVLVPRTEKEMVTGCTWESSKWPDHSTEDILLVRCYIGWFGHDEFMAYDDTSLVKEAGIFLENTFGITASPLLSKVFKWPRALPQYMVGHHELVRSIESENLLLPGIFLTGSAYHGVGVPDCIHDAKSAAEALINYLVADRRQEAEEKPAG